MSIKFVENVNLNFKNMSIMSIQHVNYVSTM